MKVKRKDRIGETRTMNDGNVAKIIGVSDKPGKVIIKFIYSNEEMEVYYGNFAKGEVKSNFTPSVCGVGIVGKIDNSNVKSYQVWQSMIHRCYDSNCHKKYPTYENCEVCEEWKYYSNFKKWFKDNYYEIEGEIMCLDKDILIKGNKTYSPDTCIFVPNNINVLFSKSDNNRGNYPIGVYYFKPRDNYRAYITINNKQKHLGYFNTPEEAFYVYKNAKEKHIKEVADEYKSRIPKRLYEAMYKWEVDIND